MENAKNKLMEIGQGMLYEPDEECRKNLGEFYCRLAREDDFDEELASCLIEAADRVNDSVVSLFNRLYDAHFELMSFRAVIYLFDENIDLKPCENLLFDVLTLLHDRREGSVELMDEILKNSSGQESFEENLKKYIAACDKEKSMVESASLENEPIMDVQREFINHLKSENEKLSKQMEEYKAKEKSFLKESYETKAEKDKYMTELEDIKRKHSKLSLSLKLLENKYDKLQEMLEQEHNVNTKLTAEISEASDSATVKVLERELSELKTALSKIDEENVQISSQNEALIADRDTIKKENEKFTITVSGLYSKIATLEEENVSLKDEVNGLRNLVADTRQFKPASEETDNVFFLPPESEEYNPYASYNPPFSDFTASIFNDEEKEEYSEKDVIPIESGKTSVIKGCNIFAKLLSSLFEKKFEKKPQAEQNNLIFVKLMEGNYSKDVLITVKKTIENSSSVSRIELYKLISNKSDENDILRYCKNAA